MGNGRYSQDWDYSQWFSFNNFQRIHYNYLEHYTPVVTFMFISIFYHPLACAILGFIYALGRLFYSIGYAKSPNLRGIGAIILDLALIGLFILSLVSIGKWLQY